MQIEIIGTERKFGQRLVRFEGRDVWLRGKAFKYLTILAAARVTNDWWVEVEKFDVSYNVSRNIYRLKQELKAAGICDIIENGRWCEVGRGYYRLKNVSRVRLDDSLSEDADMDIRLAMAGL
ncbi:MAG: hypothetical protein JRJ62_15215 [Deltaproteobacteria bacterium]|nr:hypothetical protein [Deltaproteobacteria bacterium]